MNPKYGQQDRDKKGKFATKKQINKKEKMRETGKLNKDRKAESISITGKKNPVEGSRVIDIPFMCAKMFCKKCDEPLLIQNIIGEKIHGLASTFVITCTKCTTLSEVDTGRKYIPSTAGESKKQQLFAINTKVAMGKYFLKYTSQFL